MNWLVSYNCMMRHMKAWRRREENDPESELSRLGHAVCNLAMLFFYAVFHQQRDNRPPAEPLAAGPELCDTAPEPVHQSERGEQDDFDKQFDEKFRLQEKKKKSPRRPTKSNAGKR